VKRLKIDRAAAFAATMLAATALFATAGAAAATGATTATWSGASSSNNWSTPGNWRGNAAPSGTVGVLALPPAGPSCTAWGCSFGVDDIASLAVGTLRIDSSSNYLVAPMSAADSIELLKGLNFSSTAPPASGRLLTKMVVPLTLGRAQTWTVSGVPGTSTELALGAVVGEADPFTVRMTGGVTLQAAEIDTGPLKLTGGGSVVIAEQMAEPADGIPALPPPLIGAQGVRLANGASLEFSSADSVSGPIAVAPGSYSTLQIGRGVAPDGTATVDGNVTLRVNSTLQMWIDQAAVAAQAARKGKQAPAQPQPSTDASQLTVFGNLDLNGASLALSQGFTDTQIDCAKLAGGQVYTLVEATQLVGNFHGIGDGQVVPLGVCNPLGTASTPAVIISYNTRARPQTITATVVGAAQIKALVGRTLALAPVAPSLQGVLAAGGHNTSFNAPIAGRLSLTWTAVSHGRRVAIASGSNAAGQVGPRVVLIKLTTAGRRLLYADDHPPAPKPIKIRVKVKVKVKGKGKGAGKHKYTYKYKLKRLPPPKPKPVTITARASFTPRGQKAVTVSSLFTLR
jgi:hypothetical protein